MRYGLIRLDIEDFLTPESDDGLQAMLDQLDRHRLPASYGVVGEKAVALAQRGRGALLKRLSEKPALGFHSTSHSRHPTLAEELDLMEYEAGVKQFLVREGRGRDMVSQAIKPPVYFTQPGGNWVPQAVKALPEMGMGLYFSESRNSYIVEYAEPLWLEDVLHFSLPVPTPAPFLLGLPDNLDEALERLQRVTRGIPEGGAFTIMTHPTELVSLEFWDAVNFARGQTRPNLRPAPLRSRSERERAIQALDQYFLAASAMAGIEWVDVLTLADKIQPRRAVVVTRQDVAQAIAKTGIGPTRLKAGTLSAAQVAYALAFWVIHPTVSEMAVPLVKAPLEWGLAEPRGQVLDASRLMQAAEALVADVDSAGRLPSKAADVSVETVALMAAERLLGDQRPVVLSFLSYVKPPQHLHWDWPIFPPDFRPYRLWQETRRLSWNLAPVVWRQA